MKKNLSKLLLFVCSFICLSSLAQQDSVSRDFFCGTGLIKNAKGTFYLGWGYNKNWYSNTDVHVHDASGDYDFTIYDMKAHDHTHFEELFKVALSIPQYGYRIGYWLPRSKYGLEIKFDHAKYIVYDDQYVHIKGKIGNSIVDTTQVVPYSMMHLEHTDGANFLMLNAMYREGIWANRFVHIYGEAKVGGGIVVPRSDVVLFGQEWNHCFHNAGQVFGAEIGVRIELTKYFFIEPSAKGVFANYNKVLAIDDALISHRFWDGMVLLDIGFQIPMGKRTINLPQPTW